MKRLFNAALAMVALLAVSGCVSITDAPAGAFKVGNAYSVTLTRQWADISQIMNARPKNVRLLSIDGPLLNRLYLTDALSPGDYLVKPASKEKPTPTYRADLSPTEIVEFVANSVSALDYLKVETSNLRPGQFAGTQGIRFDLTATTKEGLDISGTALATEKGGKLYVILCLAPTEHYYGDVLPEVEAIMQSASVAG